MNRPTDMALSDAELIRHTRDLDEMHHGTLAGFRSALDELAGVIRDEVDGQSRIRRLAATRRNFLKGGLVTAGTLGGGLVLAACGTDAGTTTATPSPTASGDLKVAQLAASLEVLAVSTYQTAIAAATAGKFGAVPPAIVTFATTAMAQHRDHENGWNAALTKAGLPAQTAPDPKYNQIVQQALPGLHTIVDVAKLALTLETVAVETYTAGASLLADKANRAVALTIAPVEAQHVAVLNFVLGMYPVPNSFMPTDMAASPSDLG